MASSNKHYHGKGLMHLLIEHQTPFAEGNIMKYVFRWREKGGVADLYKAQDYLTDLIYHEQAIAAEEKLNEKDPF